MSLTPAEEAERKSLRKELGGSLTPDEQAERESLRKELDNSGYDWRGAPGRVLDAASTAARSGLESASMGVSEPVLSGMSAAYNTATGGDLSLDALKKNYQTDVDRRRQAKKDQPVSDFGGGLIGALSPVGPAQAVANKVGGLVAKGASAVLPEMQAADGAGKLARGTSNLYNNAKGVITGSAQGSAGALAQEAPRQVIEGTTGFIKKGDDNVPSLGDTATFGAKFGAAVPALGTLARGAGQAGNYAGKKLMASFLGPSEEHINYYLEHPEAVNGAKSIEELKDKVDGITDRLREDVASGEKTVIEAKQDLRDVEQAVSAHRSQSNYDFAVTTTQVKQQFRDSKNDLENAFNAKKRDLENVKPPLHLADEATQAVKDLKGKVIAGSKAATDELEGQGGRVETSSPYAALKSTRNRLNIAGKGPVTPQAKAAAAQIDQLMATFGSLPSHLSFSETKPLIQQIDQSEKAIYNSGEFTDDVANAFKTLRAQLDQQLKGQNPSYAEAMKPVAEMTRLHSEVAPVFGDKESALSSLNRINSPTSAVQRDNLTKLGEATGRDFETPVKQYSTAQGILKNPEAMENIRASLPEAKKHAELESLNRQLEGPEAKAEFINNNLAKSGLLEQQKAKEGLLAKKQGLLEQNKSSLEPFKNLTPNSSEAKLKTAMNSRSGEQVELKRQLQDLSSLSDTDFVKALKDLKTKNAFNGQDTNGSRKVNLFGMVIGGAFAAAASTVGHATGGAAIGVPIGAAVGAIADKYGPKISKSILDGVIKMGRSPTLAKIQSLEIPPQAKAYLAKELADYNGPEK